MNKESLSEGLSETEAARLEAVEIGDVSPNALAAEIRPLLRIDREAALDFIRAGLRHEGKLVALEFSKLIAEVNHDDPATAFGLVEDIVATYQERKDEELAKAQERWATPPLSHFPTQENSWFEVQLVTVFRSCRKRSGDAGADALLACAEPKRTDRYTLISTAHEESVTAE